MSDFPAPEFVPGDEVVARDDFNSDNAEPVTIVQVSDPRLPHLYLVSSADGTGDWRTRDEVERNA